MKKNILNLFGLGKTKFSASTASLFAVLNYWAFYKVAPGEFVLNSILFLGVLLWCVFSLMKNKAFAEQDAKEIVVDEFLGMYVCLLIANTQEILWMVVLFVAFRVLDILKPPPFSIIDKKFKNGFGVMADDIAIGIFLGILFQLAMRFML